MPSLARSGPVEISLVALPEASAAIVYGLHEVFSCVGTVWERLTGEKTHCRRMTPRIVAAERGSFMAGYGTVLTADATFAEIEHSDVVIVPDMNFPPGATFDGRWPEAIEWLRAQHDRGAIVGSVCTGAVMLAEAGLLDGLEATSHWSATPLIQQCYPRVLLKSDRILVPSGHEHRIVTSGGSASWNDLALYLVARFCGEAEARRIAKIFLFGDRQDGQQPFATMIRPVQHDDAAIAAAQTWIADHYAVANPVARMASRVGLADRTFKRRFKRATGYAPLDYVQSLRVEEAKQMLETTDDPIDDVATSVGYDDPNSFRRLFKRTTGVSPKQYRVRFARVSPRVADLA